MIIRQYHPADEPSVLELWLAAGLAVPWNDPAADIATHIASGQNLLFVATAQQQGSRGTRDELVVGTAMAGFDGHRGWIYYLAVAPEHQRRAVGRRLVARCERDLAARGCPKVNLMVRTENEQAVGFYRALGYDPSPVTTLGRRLDSSPAQPPP